MTLETYVTSLSAISDKYRRGARWNRWKHKENEDQREKIIFLLIQKAGLPLWQEGRHDNLYLPSMCVCVCVSLEAVCVAAQLPSSLLPVRSACHISFNFPITATPAAQSSQVCVWQEAVVTRCRQYYDVQYDEVEEMLHGEKVVMHSWWNNQTSVKNNIVLEHDSDMKHHTSVIKTHMELLIIQKCRGMHVQTCQHSGFFEQEFHYFQPPLSRRACDRSFSCINLAISASQLRGGLQILPENLPFFPTS